MSLAFPKDQLPALPPHAPRARLRATGPSISATCETTQPVTLIGSRRDGPLSLQHPDVSKVHCALLSTGSALLVCDLGSRTGTFLNDKLVTVAALKSGDVLRVGPVTVQVKLILPKDGARPDASRNRVEVLAFDPPLRFIGNNAHHEIRDNAALIGRRDTCHVVIDNPDVSLSHAMLFALDGRPVIFDLQSRSGTSLNGQRVTLAWLHDGDEVCVGNETLRVSWSGPSGEAQPSVRSEPEVVLPRPSPATAPRRAALDLEKIDPLTLDPERELGEIEQTIGALQAQFAQSQAQLETRGAELDARCAQLDQREASLAALARDLERRSAALEAAERAVQQQRDECAKMEAAARQLSEKMAEREKQVEAKASELAREQTELLARAARLEKEQSQVGTAREELNQKRSALESENGKLAGARKELDEEKALVAAEGNRLMKLQTQIEQRLAQCTELEADLQVRERSMNEREKLVKHVESSRIDSLRRMRELKATLQEVSTKFTTTAQPSDALSRKSGSNGGRNGRGSVKGAKSAGTELLDAKLPAPMVDQPLFAASPGEPPTQWPSDLQDRFRVLRRVSDKSDAELLTQVWQEAHARQADEESTKRRKRRWWS